MKQLPARSAPFLTTNTIVTALFTVLLTLMLAHPAFAQEASATAGAPLVMDKTLFQRLMAAGPAFMGTLFMASVFMVWLVIDGILRTSKAKLAPPSVVAGIRQSLIDGDYETATQMVTFEGSVFSEIATAAFGKVGLGKDATDDAIFEETERSRSIFTSRISYLSVSGVITPMIGLTGTVFGMINAFDTLGSSGVGDPTRLSAAIGEVLVCTGGTLSGRLYDLKQTPELKPHPKLPPKLNDKYVYDIVADFLKANCNRSKLSSYFTAPDTLYNSQIFIPIMQSVEGVKAFGVEKIVKSQAWIAHYRGKVSPPVSGSFRFIGFADDVLAVRLNGGKWQWMKEGFYTRLEAGKFYDMDIVIGECGGGWFDCMLLFEQEGVTYKKDANGNPILPVFRVADSKLDPEKYSIPFMTDGQIWRALPPPKD